MENRSLTLLTFHPDLAAQARDNLFDHWQIDSQPPISLGYRKGSLSLGIK